MPVSLSNASLQHHWIVHHPSDGAPENIGGKAAGLFRLQALGLAVPAFVVLSAEAYRVCCPEHKVPETIPPALTDCLDKIWQYLGEGNTSLAVRSSAIDEDGATTSYAGQMETRLNIRSREALTQAVLTCWESLHSQRAETYRTSRGNFNTGNLAIAVVIQHMLTPDTAGVLFTINPVSGRPDEMLISSVWGLGEGLVSGDLDADTFILNRQGDVLTRQIVQKTHQVTANDTGGTKTVAVQPEAQNTPSLSDRQLQQLVKDALQAENHTSYPLDIEFAVYNDKIYYLQARPVTGFVLQAKPEDGNRQVWDNANINESYPGITLPLTFSFIRKAYYSVYWQFCEVLGISEKTIRDHETMLANMLGLIQGRVYYNLLNWYRLVSLMPGFQFNKGFMEAMMGLETPDELPEKPMGFWQKYLEELPRLMIVGCRMIWLQWTLGPRIENFHTDFNRVYDRLNPLDFNSMPPHEALQHFETLEREVLWEWKAPIINDFSAMIYYGLLKKITTQWGIDPDGSLQNGLVSGQGNIESTQVMEQLLAIAQLIEQDKDFKASFTSEMPENAVALLNAHANIGPVFKEYLHRYGDRCMEELKLESFSMKDNPVFCVSMLQNYLKNPLPSRSSEDKNLRGKAEEILVEKLGSRLNPKYWLYQWVLFRARAAIRNRENQRLARTRAFALVRRIFRAIGAWFCRIGVLEHPRDIFYLEVEEVRAFIQGSSTGRSLKSLVALRKQDYAVYDAQPPLPDHFVTFGPVSAACVVEEDPIPETGGVNTDNTLYGQGACPGKLTASAVVLLKPDTQIELKGEILVTRQTDPGWVVLFPAISGLVVERGSMLSHSAIVAREMGIPAVVGVKNAVKRIQTGDTLTLDGQHGSVEIMPKAGDDEANS